MAITENTLALCRAIVATPHLFRDTEAFSKAIRKIASDALISRSDLAQLREFFATLKDGELFDKLVGLLTDPQIKTILKKIDRHWLVKDVHSHDLRKRLIGLANGRSEIVDDPKKKVKILRERAAALCNMDDFVEAKTTALAFGDELSLILGAMTIAQGKKLLKACDPANQAFAGATVDQITTYLGKLLTEKTHPVSQDVKKPRAQTSPSARSAYKSQPSNPMESAAMGAKWDGIDRD